MKNFEKITDFANHNIYLNYKEKLESAAKEKFKSFRQFALKNGHTPQNIKKQILFNIEKLNRLIKPLGLRIELVD